MAQYGFPHKEHLVSRTDIEALFMHKSGVINDFPLRLIYKEMPDTADDVPIKVLISVSKRHFKLAVDRNRAKRQIREAYRLNKAILWDALVPTKTSDCSHFWRKKMLRKTSQSIIFVSSRRN